VVLGNLLIKAAQF